MTLNVTIPSATGNVRGYFARRATREQLPAVLLIPDKDGLSDWMKQNAREIASIGYVTLALDLRRNVKSDERTLADLSAAVRWLRRRADVFPDRIGVVGWGWGGQQALSLAGSMSLQACVVCDSRVTAVPSIFAGLRRSPVLAIFAGNSSAASAFRQALQNARIPHKIRAFDKVRSGFICPTNRQTYVKDAAEEAWFEIYEFLGKYVEDADLNAPSSIQVSPSVATIADIMRSVNSPTGTRGALIQSLEKEPANSQEWNKVRAHAAMIAEAGHLLQRLTPRKGTHSSWTEKAMAYTEAAESVAVAADKRDYAAAQRGLQQLATTCGACHTLHR